MTKLFRSVGTRKNVEFGGWGSISLYRRGGLRRPPSLQSGKTLREVRRWRNKCRMGVEFERPHKETLNLEQGFFANSFIKVLPHQVKFVCT